MAWLVGCLGGEHEEEEEDGHCCLWLGLALVASWGTATEFYQVRPYTCAAAKLVGRKSWGLIRMVQSCYGRSKTRRVERLASYNMQQLEPQSTSRNPTGLIGVAVMMAAKISSNEYKSPDKLVSTQPHALPLVLSSPFSRHPHAPASPLCKSLDPRPQSFAVPVSEPRKTPPDPPSPFRSRSY